jgi:hypothetical protein
MEDLDSFMLSNLCCIERALRDGYEAKNEVKISSMEEYCISITNLNETPPSVSDVRFAHGTEWTSVTLALPLTFHAHSIFWKNAALYQRKTSPITPLFYAHHSLTRRSGVDFLRIGPVVTANNLTIFASPFCNF